MTKDDLMQMAREAKCGHESMTLDWIPPDGLEQFANAVLERAAMECEDTDIEEARGMSYYAQLGDAGATRDSIASAIRALKIPEGE